MLVKAISRVAKLNGRGLQTQHIVVVGYTDNTPIGPALAQQGITSNQILSQKRAEAVMQAAIEQGVKPELLSADGEGDADPVASNDTPAGRAKNRRVELRTGTATSPSALVPLRRRVPGAGRPKDTPAASRH